MSRIERARELKILPEFVFYDPLEIPGGQLNGLNELFDTDVEIDTFFLLVSNFLVKPKQALYNTYDDEVSDESLKLSEKAFYELRETGIEPLDAAYYFYMYNKKKDANYSYNELLEYINDNLELFRLRRQLEEDYFNSQAVNFMKNYDTRLKDFIELSVKQLIPRQNMDEIKTDLSIVEESILRSFLVFECKTDKDHLEHFNFAEVSYTIPYITVHPYRKIFQGSKVYTEEWNTKNQNALVGYIRTASLENERSYSQFQLSGNQLVLESRSRDIDIENPGASMKKSIEECLQDIKINDLIREEISVECFIKDVDIHGWALKHFLYTDPVMKHFYFMDESSIISRKRNFITLYYYRDPSDSVTPPIVITLGNREVGQKDTRLLSGNKCHTRVYVKRCTREELSITLTDLKRCFSKFGQERARILADITPLSSDVNKEYESDCKPRKGGGVLTYGSIFGESKKIRTITQSNFGILDKIDTNKYEIINPSDLPDYIQTYQGEDEQKEKISVLIYPKKSDQDKIPTYGYYVKPGVTNKYIGIKEDDSMDPPYIISSFAVNQMEPTGLVEKTYPALKSYLEGDVAAQKSIPISKINTSRPLDITRYGSLQSPVETWVSYIIPEYNIFRYGLLNFYLNDRDNYIPPAQHHASIIYILLAATYKTENITEADVIAVKQKMEEIIDINPIYLTETYNYTAAELKLILKENRFIDPRLFYYILAEIFNVEIFMFYKPIPKNKSPFEPCVPYYHSPLSSSIQYDSYVMIAINTGGEFDRFPFPMCEICYISKKEKAPDSSISFIYTDDEPDATTLRKAFVKKIQTDMFGIDFATHNFSRKPTHQSIDSFGRMNWLHFDSIHARLIKPAHSESYPILENKDYLNNEKEVRDFLRTEKCNQVIEDRDKADNLIGIIGVFSRGMKNIFLLPYRFYFPIKEEETSELIMYREYERVSRYLIEYAYRAFSLYLEKSKVLNFVEFSQQNFIIEPNHVYNQNTPRMWTQADETYLRDDKLIIKSETMKVKLMYIIRQKFRTNEDLFRVYYLLDYMPNFYASTTDFIQQSKTLLIDRPFEDKKQEQGSIYIKITSTPYILYRKLEEFGHTVWLCQPADNLLHAIWICEQWNATGANPINKGELMGDHFLLHWVDPLNYKIYNASDNKRIVSEIELDDGTSHYQAILPYLVM